MAIELNFSKIQTYLAGLVPPRPTEMQQMELYASKQNFPIIGPVAGYFCYQVARMIGANRVFEMGSGFGYSTAWFAMAVKENGGGTVHHVVWDKALSKKAREHLSALGLVEIVKFHISEAVQTLHDSDEHFDLIFNDIEKKAYPESLPVIKEKLRAGGVLIVDNMFWLGRVFDPDDRSADTEGVREFTRRITNDPDWIASIVPIRDGLLVAYKK